jgi:hypothetical protein
MGCNCGKRTHVEYNNNPSSGIKNPWMCKICGWVMHNTKISGKIIRCCRNGKCKLFEKEQV